MGREGERGRAPSLLLGLVYDGNGQRYTPSHTLHNARRYRYYVAHRADYLQDTSPVRIPAQDLETLVVQRLLHLLSDKLALLDALSATDDDAGVLQGLLAAINAGKT